MPGKSARRAASSAGLPPGTHVTRDRRKVAAALVAAAAASQPSLAIAQNGSPPAGWATFTRLLDTYADSDRVVGTSALVMRDGKVVARHSYGFADKSTGRRVDDRSIFHWGSITKTLTAISIMQLRDRGRLSLDDKVTRWVPELREIHDPYGMIDSITIRMLLSHSSGFQNPTWPWGNGEPWEPFEPTTWNQLVAMMPYQQLMFKPGSRYGYSNPGFVYLARVIEQITGDPWDAYVQKNIFAPLEMNRSYFRGTPYFLAAHRSHNYYVRADSATHAVGTTDNGADFDPGITSPNGAWNAPVSELVKYVAFLTNALVPGVTRDRYDVVLSRSSLEEMWKPGMPMSQGYESSACKSMGLAVFFLDLDCQRILGHTVTQEGFRALYYLDPQAQRGIAAVCNATNCAAPATTLERRMNEAARAPLKP